MLYDLNFLAEGEVFPPESEVERLDGYRHFELERKGDPWEANSEYKRRIEFLLHNYELSDAKNYLYDSDEFATIVEKIKNVTVGRRPIIQLPKVTMTNDNGEKWEEVDSRTEDINNLLKAQKVYKKLRKIVDDLLVFGDVPVKLYTTANGAKNVALLSPSMWFPVVDKIDSSEPRYNVIAWVADRGDNVEDSELHAQIYDDIAGTVTNRRFAIMQFKKDRQVHTKENRSLFYEGFKLGKELNGKAFDGFSTGVFSTQTGKIIPITFNSRSNSPCGRSLFDRLEAAVMEYYIRVSLKNVVLDKFSAPKMTGPRIMKPEGEQMPNYIELSPGGTATPQYLVWDAQMTAVENAINGIKNDIANASGLGALLDSQVFGDSQGYDALMIKLTPALQEAEGLTEELEEPLTEIIEYLSDGMVTAEEITVVWKTGVPESKLQIANTAKLHKETGWTQRRVNMVDYEMSPEEASAEEEQKRKETPEIPFGGTEANWDDEDNEE